MCMQSEPLTGLKKSTLLLSSRTPKSGGNSETPKQNVSTGKQSQSYHGTEVSINATQCRTRVECGHVRLGREVRTQTA